MEGMKEGRKRKGESLRERINMDEKKERLLVTGQ
jgi:hypothetical protein